MPTPIGFLRHNFLARSETFIYGSLRAVHDAGKFSVRVFASRQLLPERFPWDDLTLVDGLARTRYLATRSTPRYTQWAKSVKLIHAHLGQTGPYAMAGARKAGIPFVVSYYGHDVVMYRTRERFESWAWWYTLTRKKVFARAAKILVLSKHMQHALEAQGCPTEKLEVVRLGVDLSRFANATSAPRDTNRARPLRVLMVGREVDKKGFDDGLRACKLAGERGVRCEVTVLGTDGPLKPQLQALAAELGVTVAWPDPASPVPAAMAAADVLLVPSRTAANGDEEGTPTVIIEGGAAGLPVVSTRHAGIPEQVVDGTTGLLCAERDTAAMAEALVALADPARRAELGAAGRAKMHAEYSLPAHVARLEEVYASVLGATS
ncbi:MAG: glycosyltransferase [Kofleriaceae bacterium]|nr:glycosyltransferase [Kofleriaceae bacterium]